MEKTPEVSAVVTYGYGRDCTGRTVFGKFKNGTFYVLNTDDDGYENCIQLFDEYDSDGDSDNDDDYDDDTEEE